jgi:hypothetical protein
LERTVRGWPAPLLCVSVGVVVVVVVGAVVVTVVVAVVGVGVGVVSKVVARLRAFPAHKKPPQASAIATALWRAIVFMASQWVLAVPRQPWARAPWAQ